MVGWERLKNAAASGSAADTSDADTDVDTDVDGTASRASTRGRSVEPSIRLSNLKAKLQVIRFVGNPARGAGAARIGGCAGTAALQGGR